MAPEPPTSVVTPDSPTVPVSDFDAPAPPTGAFEPTRVDTPVPTAPVPPVASPPTMVDPPTAVYPTPAPTPMATPAPVPAPTLPTATAKRGGGRIGALIAVIGGALAILGAFLDWMTLTPTGQAGITFSGWTLSDDAKIVLALGAVGIIAAFIVLGGGLRNLMRLVIAVVGIAVVALGAYDLYDIIENLPDALTAVGVSGVEITAPGIGLILVMAGGAVLIVGALAIVGPKDAATTAAGTAPAPMAPPPLATPPGPVGYGTPQAGYGPPPGGYGTPQPGYGPPQGGYGPPQGGYGPPQGGYSAPQGGPEPGSTTGYPPPGP